MRIPFIKALIGTFLFWQFVNLLGISFAWISFNPADQEEWSISYKWGTFYLNGIPKGFEFGSSITSLILIGTFLVLFVALISRQRTSYSPDNKDLDQ